MAEVKCGYYKEFYDHMIGMCEEQGRERDRQYWIIDKKMHFLDQERGIIQCQIMKKKNT